MAIKIKKGKRRESAEEIKARKVAEAADRIRASLEHGDRDYLKIGQDMAAAKDLIKRGEFMPWLASTFPDMKYRTAKNFMSAFEFCERYPDAKRLDRTTIYELATRRLPEEAVTQVLDQAKAGNIMTATQVRAFLRDHRTERPRSKKIEDRHQAANDALALLKKHLRPAILSEFVELVLAAENAFAATLKR
jgi:hypothetical protein